MDIYIIDGMSKNFLFINFSLSKDQNKDKESYKIKDFHYLSLHKIHASLFLSELFS